MAQNFVTTKPTLIAIISV